MRNQGVLCSGSIVLDILLLPVEDSGWGTTTFVESLEYHVGGNGANTARALAALGTPARLLGVVGNDDQGRSAMQTIASAGVDVSAIRSERQPTATSVVMVNGRGDRKFLHRLGASAAAFADGVEFTPEITCGMSHYHLASLFVLPQIRQHAGQILRDARAAGLTTSVDVNWDATGQWMITLAPCLPDLDVLFLNEDEARMVTGCRGAAPAAEAVLELGVRAVVIKLGERGCAIYTPDREVLCPAFEIEVRDTTGAGDCFAAGFLTAWLGGSDLHEAGDFGNAVAALSVQKLGAVVGIPSADSVRRWMGQARVRAGRMRPRPSAGGEAGPAML